MQGYPPSQTQPQAQQYPQTQLQNQQYPQTQNQAQPPYQQQRVNPAAIPSVVAVLEADRDRFKDFGPFLTCTHIAEHPPPLPSSIAHISVVDDGNSAPNFIRTTMNHVPVSEELCENSKIPLSLLIQPFAAAAPIADLGELGPIRCNRCRAYINPHCQFIKGGREFICNLCDMSNEVPEQYYANLDMNGKRIDLDLRPELKYGTVDFVATKVLMIEEGAERRTFTNPFVCVCRNT
jgi:protein transport protein SEC24